MFLVKYIYIALHQASQYQSKHNNNVRFLVEKHPCSVELIKDITDWLINLNIPKRASQRQQWQGTEKLHQVTQRCPKTPSGDPMVS